MFRARPTDLLEIRVHQKFRKLATKKSENLGVKCLQVGKLVQKMVLENNISCQKTGGGGRGELIDINKSASK